MNEWFKVLMLGAGVLAAAGCSSDKSTPTMQSEPPVACTGGNSCKCADGARSLTRCETDDSEVCDCACSDFAPLDASSDFNACGGNLDGGWELTAIDLSGVPSSEFAHGCDTVQVTDEDFKFRLLFPGELTDRPSQAQVDRGTEEIDLQLLRSCVNPQASCKDLSLTETDCGTCKSHVERGGIIDDAASWHTKSHELLIAHPNFRGSSAGIMTDDYDYCVTKDTLRLRDHELGVGYTLTRRYFSGNADSCLSRSLKACEKLDGCHEGQCQGSTDCQLNDNQSDCEDYASCTWHAELCGGKPSKHCDMKDYGVDPACTVSDAAP